MQSYLLTTVVVMAVLLTATLIPAYRARQRLEFRAQILELMATAARRNAPLGSLLAMAAREHRGRRHETLWAAAELLDEGSSLSDTLEQVASYLFSPRVIAAIRASEGTAQLPAVLDSLSRGTAKALSARHHVAMTLFYPICLGLFLIGMQTFYADISAIRYHATGNTADPGLTLNQLATAGVITTWIVIGTLVLYRLVGRRFATLRRIVDRGARAVPAFDRLVRLVDGERLLRSTSALISAGLSLPEAVRRAAKATANPRFAEAALASAELMDSGISAEKAWDRTLLPEFAAVRAATATGAPAAQLAVALDTLATECGHRLTAQTDRLLRWIHPTAIIVFGGLLALQFGGMFQHIYSMHHEVSLW